MCDVLIHAVVMLPVLVKMSSTLTNVLVHMVKLVLPVVQILTIVRVIHAVLMLPILVTMLSTLTNVLACISFYCEGRNIITCSTSCSSIG